VALATALGPWPGSRSARATTTRRASGPTFLTALSTAQPGSADDALALLARASAFFRSPGALFLLILPLAVTDGLLPDLGGKNPVFFLLLFIYGYLLVASEDLQQAMDRHRWWALALAALMSAITLVAVALNLQPARFSAMDIVLFFARMSAAWCWTIAMLGLGRRYLTDSRPLLRYARGVPYPIYILHQTVIVAIAFVVVSWQMRIAVKYGASLLAASVGTLLIYEFLVRRVNPMRFLVGLKPQAKEKSALESASMARGIEKTE
jgi:hypothetical protein